MKFDRIGRFAAVVALLAGLGAGVPGLAAENAAAKAGERAPLEVVLTVHRVVQDAQGQESLVDGPQARPGDLLEYRAVYTNRTAQPMTQVLATLPLPLETEYLLRTARPSAVTASTGADYAPEPLLRKVRGADGKDTLVPVPAAQYRSLRWRIASIDAGRSVTVSARVRVAGLAGTPGVAAASPVRTASLAQLLAR